MYENHSDESVMVKLKSGDKSALSELMNRWHGRLWYFVNRLVRSPALTDDICQEVWARLYVYGRRYKPARSFRAYLFSIALNSSRSAMTRLWRRREVSLQPEDSFDDPPGDEAPPDAGLIQSEDRQKLRLAIDHLPTAERTVVLLYLFCSSDYSQIARMLDKRVSTVRGQMSTALRRLRSLLSTVSLTAERQVNHE